jgi:hypothetical protein
MPFSVDGLIVVASISQVELAARIRATHNKDTATSGTADVDTGHTAEVTADVTADVTAIEPAIAPAAAAVPLHLIPAARFAVTNHHATTGRAITADELAARMSVPGDTARQLLTLIDHTDPAHDASSARANGARIGDGGR